LDKLGHLFNLIPKSVPFEGVFSDVSLDSTEAQTADNFKTTNPVLKDAIENEDKFCELYEVCNNFAYVDVEYHVSSTRRI